MVASITMASTTLRRSPDAAEAAATRAASFPPLPSGVEVEAAAAVSPSCSA